MMLLLYPSKKVLKENVGCHLKYKETSMFGEEYKETGTFTGANRPSITGIGRKFFATVTMKDHIIVKVS